MLFLSFSLPALYLSSLPLSLFAPSLKFLFKQEECMPIFNTERFTSSKTHTSTPLSHVLIKEDRVHGRQIAFVAAFLLPLSKFLETPALLSKYAAGDLLLPAILHFLLQSAVLGVLLFVVFRSQTPLITRLQQGLGKFFPLLCIFYAAYFIFGTILPLLDLEKFVYAAFFDTEPTVFSFGLFFILSAFICTKGIQCIGRVADLCLFLFVVPFFAIVLMALSSSDFTHLLPLFGSKFGHTMSAFTRVTPHFSDAILLLPLLCYYPPKKEDKKKIMFGYAFGAICTLVFLAVFYSTYSALAPREHYAFSKIAQYFPALSVLGRIDLIFVYLLSIVLLFFTCIPLQYSVQLLSVAFNKATYKIGLSFLLNTGLFFFVLYCNKYYNSFYDVFTRIFPIIFWFIADMVPLFLIFLPKYEALSTPSHTIKNEHSIPKKEQLHG